MNAPAHKQQQAPGAKALAPAVPSVAVARYNQASRDVSALQALLEQAARECHLVSPATSIGAVPEGFVVATSAILVDIKAETYKVGAYDDDDDGGARGGKLGLGKTALDRIAMAAGVSWDPHLSRRMDDGKDPAYCAWLAVGRYTGFDGREIVVQATKEVDLRDHSPQVDGLWERYESKLAKWKRGGEQGYPPKSPEAQVREQRLHIVSLAETKARLRAIRALGIRTGYTAEELAKPFVVAKLAFTGATSDPSLKRDFALMQAAHFLDSRSALYGGAPAERPALPPPTPAPIVEEGTDVPCDYCGVEDEVQTLESPAGPIHHCGASRCQELARADAAREPAASAPQASYPRSQQPDPTPAASSGARPPAADHPSPAPAAGAAGRSEERDPGQTLVRFGRNHGQCLSDIGDRDIEWYASAIRKSIGDPGKAQYRRDNERHLQDVEAVQRARREGAQPDPCGSDDDRIPS